MNFLHYNALVISFLLFNVRQTQAQTNPIQSILNNKEVGKTYALYPNPSGTKTDIYWIKIIPPRYEQVEDSIEISPALNGDMDTANYFVQTEVVELRESAAEWHLAKVADICFPAGKANMRLALSLQKNKADFDMVHRRFYPFKNILDVSEAENIIPAQYMVVKREVLIESAKMEFHSKKPTAQGKEKVIEIPAGTWFDWEELHCPEDAFILPEMKTIQEKLKKEGYTIEITNAYDEQTEKAVHEFQRDHQLPEGKIDKKMLDRMRIKLPPLIDIE